jgi:hypothetical protein
MTGYTITGIFLISFAGFWYYNDVVLAEQRSKDPEYQAEIQEKRADYLSNNTEYIRDVSTGVCFARMTSPPHGMGIATVDCDKLDNVPVTDFNSKTK